MLEGFVVNRKCSTMTVVVESSNSVKRGMDFIQYDNAFSFISFLVKAQSSWNASYIEVD